MELGLASSRYTNSDYSNHQLYEGESYGIPPLYHFLSYHKKLIKFVSREPDKVRIYDNVAEILPPDLFPNFEDLLEVDEEFVICEDDDTLTYTAAPERCSLSANNNIFLIEETINFIKNTLTRRLIGVLFKSIDSVPMVESNCLHSAMHDFSLIQIKIEEGTAPLLAADSMTIYYQYLLPKSQFGELGLTQIEVLSDILDPNRVIFIDRNIYLQEFLNPRHVKNVSSMMNCSYQSTLFRFCCNAKQQVIHPEIKFPVTQGSRVYNTHGKFFRSTTRISPEIAIAALECPVPMAWLLLEGYEFYPLECYCYQNSITKTIDLAIDNKPRFINNIDSKYCGANYLKYKYKNSISYILKLLIRSYRFEINITLLRLLNLRAGNALAVCINIIHTLGGSHYLELFYLNFLEWPLWLLDEYMHITP